MITYSLLMTVGVIAFVVGLVAVLLNMALIVKNGMEAWNIVVQFISGFITWIGAVLTVAGFIWFLAVLVSRR